MNYEFSYLNTIMKTAKSFKPYMKGGGVPPKFL